MSINVAMWSGPRNISTAMMRAWENRTDTAVWDEPLYAYYLATTGLDHPGKDRVIEAGLRDWRDVVARCVGPAPDDKAVFYQKHMSHHMLAAVDRSWLTAPHLRHCFLIRDPIDVLISYSKTRATVALDDIGLTQQLELYEYLVNASDAAVAAPLVIDSADFLQNPRGYLLALCEQIGLDFSERMLRWPEGRRDSDGVWGEYWYSAVWRSSRFTPYQARTESLPARLLPVAQLAQPYYDALRANRLRL